MCDVRGGGVEKGRGAVVCEARGVRDASASGRRRLASCFSCSTSVVISMTTMTGAADLVILAEDVCAADALSRLN